MKDGMMRNVMAGALLGAGALWAMSTMTRDQRKTLGNYANQAANKVKDKANDIIGK